MQRYINTFFFFKLQLLTIGSPAKTQDISLTCIKNTYMYKEHMHIYIHHATPSSLGEGVKILGGGSVGGGSCNFEVKIEIA